MNLPETMHSNERRSGCQLCPEGGSQSKRYESLHRA